VPYDAEYQREYKRQRRAAAKAAGVVLPCDQWAANNPKAQAAKTARWRAENPDKAALVTRSNQADRRSTPWGAITNRIQAVIHDALRNKRDGAGSKYCAALDYTWFDLRYHLESLFTDDMTWENRGDVWEIDHIKPISSFRYVSISHPDFRECWALENLRPLHRPENASKFNKPA
jgi:hypothetical protein